MIVIADTDASFRARVAERLGARNDVLEADGTAQLESIMRTGSPVDVVLLGPNMATTDGLALARHLQLERPDVSVVLVARVLGSDLLQEALRCGIRDVLPDGFSAQQLAESVRRAETLAAQIRRRAGAGVAPESPDDGRVLTVFGAKGGVGKSFVASNLAVFLAQDHPDQVALLDLDLQSGDLAIMLQLFPVRTVYDAVQNLERLDGDALRGYLMAHRSGVSLLAAPIEPGLAEVISSDAVQRILRMLKETFRYVVIDTPPAFTDHVLGALDLTDELVLMTTMDVPSIKNLKVSLQTLELLGISRERLRLVLNRADSKVGLHVGEVEKTLRTSVDVSIPSSREVPLSINRGVPVVSDDPKSPVSAAIARLGELVRAAPAADAPEHPVARRWFARRK